LPRHHGKKRDAYPQASRKDGSADLSYGIAGVAGVSGVNHLQAARKLRHCNARSVPRTKPRIRGAESAGGQLKEFVDLRNGIVLCDGPTGSEISSTLRGHPSDNMNEEKAYHISRLKTPSSFLHRHRKRTIHQRTALRHTYLCIGFASALRRRRKSFLVGEMRDRETIEIALGSFGNGAPGHVHVAYC